MTHKPFSILNSRGLKLAGIITTPTNSGDDKKYPAMILLHGFRGYKEEPHLATLADALTEQGIEGYDLMRQDTEEAKGHSLKTIVFLTISRRYRKCWSQGHIRPPGANKKKYSMPQTNPKPSLNFRKWIIITKRIPRYSRK